MNPEIADFTESRDPWDGVEMPEGFNPKDNPFTSPDYYRENGNQTAQDLVDRICEIEDKTYRILHERNVDPENPEVYTEYCRKVHAQEEQEYRAAATEFLAKHGIEVREEQGIDVWQHTIFEEGRRKIMALIVGNKKTKEGIVMREDDATWYYVDPMKSAIEVRHNTGRKDEKGWMLVKHMPDIPYR